jgi:hypothetical protein
VKSDGSLHCRRGDAYGTTGELVSPPLHSSEEGLEEVKRVCKLMSQAGATVNKSCGFHVHVDAAGLSGADIAMVISRYAANESLINEFMAPSRQGNHFCRPVTQIYGIDVSNRLSRYIPDLWTGLRAPRVIAQNLDRYCAVNLAAFVRHGTIEFRQHAGTMNWRKVTSWVRFLVSFVEQSREQVRSRVERFLISTPTVPAPESPMMGWMNAILTSEADSGSGERTDQTSIAGSMIRYRELMQLRYNPRWFCGPSGRATPRRSVARWGQDHAFKTIFKYFIRRATVAYFANPSISNTNYVSYETNDLQMDSCYGPRPDNYGRRFYSYLNNLVFGLTARVRPGSQRNHSLTLLAHKIARETVELQGFGFVTEPMSARSNQTTITAPFSDSYARTLWVNIERFWARIYGCETLPVPAVLDSYLALPMSRAGAMLDFGVPSPWAIPANILKVVFGSFEPGLTSPSIPAGVSVPLLSELTGPENLWLGVSTNVSRYLSGRGREMQRLRDVREAARVARRAERAAARAARRAGTAPAVAV